MSSHGDAQGWWWRRRSGMGLPSDLGWPLRPVAFSLGYRPSILLGLGFYVMKRGMFTFTFFLFRLPLFIYL